jgi:GNAT superfamily N-acetyltransferase
METQIHPLTADRWQDLEKLFGDRGAYSGCWCTFWRIERTEFNELGRQGRKTVMKAMVERNDVPGLLAYVDGIPAGWCSVGSRESFQALEKSRILRRVDDRPVWSIVCYFISKPYRQQGLMSGLLRGAVEYARNRGAQIIEGYPIDLESAKLAGQKLGGCSGYMGIAAAYRLAGFIEVGRASETQLIMRYQID